MLKAKTPHEPAALPTVPPEFRQLFRRLVIAFQPRAFTPDTIAVYWDFLGARYPPPVLEAAVDRLIATHTFFPKIGEWMTAAAAVINGRALEARSEGPCSWCQNRGLIRIEYQSGEPPEIAICDCPAAAFYRKAGEWYIRLLLQLPDDFRVADVETILREKTTTEDGPTQETP